MKNKNSKQTFLQQIFFLSWLSFGGPQAHYLLFEERFVKKIKWLTLGELQEIFSLCQMLPGPSSTQLLTLIAYQKQGSRFALLTLLIWLFPACLLMALFSFAIPHLAESSFFNIKFFAFLFSFVLGLLLFNTLNQLHTHIKKKIDAIAVFIFTIVFVLFYHTPWIFIVILCLCCITSSVFYKTKQALIQTEKKILRKRFLFLFIGIFVLAGFLSEQARMQQWKNRKPFNLFENTYRFGSTVFGGGNVLASMMYEQYAVRSKTQYIKKSEALVGLALSQTTPGPVFAYATYIGGLIFYRDSVAQQLLGCLIATIGIFLPGYLISIFCFQIWTHLKKYAFMPIALHAIHLSVCIILLGTFLFLFSDYHFYQWQHHVNIVHTFYIAVVCLVLYKKWMPTTLLFFISLGLGVLYTYV